MSRHAAPKPARPPFVPTLRLVRLAWLTTALLIVAHAWATFGDPTHRVPMLTLTLVTVAGTTAVFLAEQRQRR